MGNHNNLMFELLENFNDIEVSESVICTEPLTLNKRTEVRYTLGKTVLEFIIYPKLVVMESNGTLLDERGAEVSKVNSFIVLTHRNQILRVYDLKDNTPENQSTLLKSIQQ